MQVNFAKILLLVGVVAIATQYGQAGAQIFDFLRNYESNRNGYYAQEPAPQMNVNVPMFYDMVKRGGSMGINVLSGLVKVERGQEAERSGLMGPRPLSVRVFGVPVYERGYRVRDPPGGSRPMPEAEPVPQGDRIPAPIDPIINDDLPIVP